MTSLRRILGMRRLLLAALVATVMLIAPPYMTSYLRSILILGVIYAVLAMGLNLLMGYVGLDSLGQAAFFGTAAYGLGLLTARGGLNWIVGAAVGLATATVVAAVFGLVAVRLKGLYFLLITLALGQVLWGAALRWGDLTGGWNGLRGVPLPTDAIAPSTRFYYFVLTIAALVGAGLYLIVRSPFGLVLKGIRERELRSTTLGYVTYRHKYVAFVIAGFVAGIAGVLNATYNGFVSPGDLSLERSFDVMLMVILGGTGTFSGPIIGALAVTALRYLLSVYIESYWLIVLGLVYIAATVWLPNGIVGLLPGSRSVGGPQEPGPEPTSQPAVPAHDVAPSTAEPIPATDSPKGRAVELSGIGKSYGDVHVLQDVNLAVAPGERLGIIGLNGAGKTTLFQVVTGIEPASSGRIALFGRDVTCLAASGRNRLGLARTFQVTMLYPKLTTAENVALALLGRPFRRYQFTVWRPVSRLTDLGQRIDELLVAHSLSEVRDVPVSKLSYGHQRQVEIALALASEPALLLLDEPTAGLSQAEFPAMLRLLRSLPRDLTILLVEHNLELIFQVVDRVIVLQEGRIIKDGTPEAVRSDPKVRQLYLGSSADINTEFPTSADKLAR